jgi:hypothetical protein
MYLLGLKVFEYEDQRQRHLASPCRGNVSFTLLADFIKLLADTTDQVTLLERRIGPSLVSQASRGTRTRMNRQD